MNLEEIQKELIKDFDFDKAIDILNKTGEEYTKDDLIANAKDLIKMVYLSREMDDVIFSATHIVATRSYYHGEEVSYSLNFELEIYSNVVFDLEKPFSVDIADNKELVLKKELEQLLELNEQEFNKNNANELIKTNINQIKKIIEYIS